MPELPDVETFKRCFEQHALNETVERTTVADERILADTSARALGRALAGRQFTQARRRGKWLFGGVATGEWVVFHFGMTGSLAVFHDDMDLPRHSKAIFHFRSGKNLAYVCSRMFGRIRLTKDVDAYLANRSIGIDALDKRLDEKMLLKLLRGRKATIKGVLMDQEAIAGIGNIYADEILFQARVNPGLMASELDRQRVADIARITARVLKTAIRHHARIRELPQGYLSRDRGLGAACPTCGGELTRAKIAGRTTYFCEACQPV